MADTKITALTALTAADPANDVIPIVDVSDTTMAASGTTKKISVNNILGASGTATLASATITGDLTVRTNKLAVTSTGVGCGVATPLVPLHAETAGTGTTAFSNFVSTFRSQAAGRDATLQFSDGTNQAAISMLSGALSFGTAGSNTRYNIDGTGISTWSVAGSTAMTLNSTGLAVGTTVNYARLTSSGSNSTGIANIQNSPFASNANTNLSCYIGHDATANRPFIQAATGNAGNAFDLLIQPYGGNVGVGVAPSAWGGFGNLQLVSGSVCVSGYDQSLGVNFFSHSSGAYKYVVTGNAVKQGMFNGQFVWSVAPSGTAGNAITFTQAMTLDASGNLLVGVTSANANGGVLQLKSGITFPATQVASSDANTLDDYEEGTTSTVTIATQTSGTITLNGSFNTLSYTKIGRLVTVTGNLTVSSVSLPIGGYIDVSGLPFARSGSRNTDTSPSISVISAVSAGATTFYGYIPTGATSTLRIIGDATQYQANTEIIISLQYFV
jgi:hypothetical protein